MIMKTNTNKYIDEVKNGFQQNKGVGSVYCYNTDILPNLVFAIVDSFRNKHPDKPIFIAVDTYETRMSISKVLREKFDSNTDNIKILSCNYINTKYNYKYDLIITVGINSEYNILSHFRTNGKFVLAILTKNIMDSNFINAIRKILPEIKTTVTADAVKTDRIYTPVEERRVGVDLSDKDKEQYREYTNYITTCINVFGNLDNIEKCKFGDTKLNISAADYRHMIAKENGWSEELNTNLDFLKQLDEVYNPNVLLERACNFYNIAKLRKDLITDNGAKLFALQKICEDNAGKKILIISKRGEFAANITKYLNNDTIVCGDYHDNIEHAIATDDYGNIILVKSGDTKGAPKIIGAQAQSTANERRFNLNMISCLSIKNSSNTKLAVACDVVIITSPFCEGIIDIKKRFNNVVFNGSPTKLYRIYCRDTIENDTINKEKPNHIITVLDEEKDNIVYDKNSDAIVL